MYALAWASLRRARQNGSCFPLLVCARNFLTKLITGTKAYCSVIQPIFSTYSILNFFETSFILLSVSKKNASRHGWLYENHLINGSMIVIGILYLCVPSNHR